MKGNKNKFLSYCCGFSFTLSHLRPNFSLRILRIIKICNSQFIISLPYFPCSCLYTALEPEHIFSALHLYCIFFFQAMDEPWEQSIMEYGVVNVTGFRIVDPTKRYVREFLKKWNTLDVKDFPGAGKNSISVSLYFVLIIILVSFISHAHAQLQPAR